MVYKEIVLEKLKELSDIEIQRRLWCAISGEVSSFTECVSQLFDDSGLSSAFEKHQPVFGPIADETLRQLDRAISRIDQSLPPADLLERPQMRVIRGIASKALRLLGENGNTTRR
jgi:hypothetical protein